MAIYGTIYFGKHYVKAPEHLIKWSKDAFVVRDDEWNEIEVEMDGSKVKVVAIIIPKSSAAYVVLVNEESNV